MGRMYTASGSTTSFGVAAGDVLQLTSDDDGIVTIHSFEVGQTSDAGNAEAEMLECYFFRGTGGGGGTTITAMQHDSGDAASSSTVKSFPTTDLTIGSDSGSGMPFNAQASAIYLPTPEERIVLSGGEIFAVGITQPADDIAVSWRITWEEQG